jgi:predicted butyrate kinase (DUF1464 family)
MPRVAGVDPGTVTFDLCVLQDGEPVLERVFESGALSHDPEPLLRALDDHGPFDLIYGPSGYGLPLVGSPFVGERELAEIVLVRPDERGAGAGIGGMRTLVRALAARGEPVVFGPGVIHLASVPAYRKYNRIDMGTADKVCSAAYAIADQSRRRQIEPAQTSFVLLEIGGAFSAALAVAAGQIVDGAGGSSGPIGIRAAGALDGEVAYLLAPALGKDTLFSGGALGDAGGDLETLWHDPRHAEGWAALLEGAAKAARALTASAPRPREIVVAGRLAAVSGAVRRLRAMLADVAPVVALVAGGASTAAHGGALLADGLTGGRHAPLVAAMGLREARGSVLDHLRLAGATTLLLG